MVTIKLFDYWDEWGWMYYGIGMGDLSASKIVPVIEAAAQAGEDITVLINSGGGSVFDGWTIYNALLRHPKNVIVRIEGIAASIASIIAMAGKEIIACKGSIMMVHKPSTCVWMYDSMNADDLRKEAEALDKIQKVLNSIYMDQTGLDAVAIDSLINEETWMTPDEMLAMNFITSIAPGKGAAVAIPQNAFNHIFNNAPAKVKQYANSYFPIINNNNMKKETSKLLKENKSVLQLVKNFFTGLKIENAESILADGTTIYYEGELAVETDVFSDSEMTTALADGDYELEDGRTITVAEGSVTAIAEASEEGNDDPENSEKIIELENRIAELEAENNEVTNALKQSNAALKKISDTKSNHEPKGRKQNFSKAKKEESEDEDFEEKLNERRKLINQNKKGKASSEKD